MRCGWEHYPLRCVSFTLWEGFNYYKPVVYVDDTFSTRKYHLTLLVTIAYQGNQIVSPLAFTIVEGETNETLIWFFQLLCQYVTPQPNLCLIIDREPTILSTLQYEEVGWEVEGLHIVYCIHHILSNFNKNSKMLSWRDS